MLPSDPSFTRPDGDVLKETQTVIDTIFEALHRKEMDGRFD